MLLMMQKKLTALTNCLKSTVFFNISAATAYEDAIKILKDTYIKPGNEVYSRHILSSRQQQEHESVDEFMDALDLIAREKNNLIRLALLSFHFKIALPFKINHTIVFL